MNSTIETLERRLGEALAENERLRTAWHVQNLIRKDQLIADQEEENDQVKKLLKEYISENERLRKAMDEAQKQEPVFQAKSVGGLWLDISKESAGFHDVHRVVYTAPVPVQSPAVAVPEFLIEMSNQMRNQDGRSTAHPFFQVRCKRFLPTEQGYSEIGFEIYSEDGIVYRSYRCEEEDLEQLLLIDYPEFCAKWRDDLDNGDSIEDAIAIFNPQEDELPDGLRLVYVQEVEEVISTHLTEHDAKAFIRRKQHDYPKLYTYAESAYWSPQFRQLQDWIISLTEPERKFVDLRQIVSDGSNAAS